MKKLIVTAVLLSTTLAQAEFWNGNKLLDRLDSEDGAERINAYGYLAGVADGRDGTNFCIPTQVQLKQIIEMVQNMLRAEPGIRHRPAADLITDRLHDQWACPTETKKKKK